MWWRVRERDAMTWHRGREREVGATVADGLRNGSDSLSAGLHVSTLSDASAIRLNAKSYMESTEVAHGPCRPRKRKCRGGPAPIANGDRR